MNLLRNQPKKEISKDITAFKINKKFPFNIKPESKFEAVINDNFFKNINSLLPKSNNNDNVFITLQAKELILFGYLKIFIYFCTRFTKSRPRGAANVRG